MSVLAPCPADGRVEDAAAAKLTFRRSMGPRASVPTVAIPTAAIPLCEFVNGV